MLIRIRYVFKNADNRNSFNSALIDAQDGAAALQAWGKIAPAYTLANLVEVTLYEVDTHAWMQEHYVVDLNTAVLPFILRHRASLTKTEREYIGPYLYARRNGYTGTITEYVALEFDTYCTTCKRNGIEPMTRAQWEK